MGCRLQAVTGAANRRCFKPHRKWEVNDPEFEFEIGEEEIERCLRNACRENGYRTLEVDTCAFKKLLRVNRPLIKNTLAHPREQTIAELNSVQGEMSLIEANVCGDDDKMRTWLWFRATKPMASISGDHPAEIREMSDSVFMFAVPTLRVALLEDS